MASSLTEPALRSRAPDGAEFPVPSAAEARASFAALAAEAERDRALGRTVVVVQGLGFVGAAAAAVIAGARDAGGMPRHFVIGVDLPTPDAYWKVAKMAAGDCPVDSGEPELPSLVRRGVLETGNLRATTAEEAYALADVVVVDVPLDVRDRHATARGAVDIDFGPFRRALEAIGSRMRPDALVLLETTVPPGTTARIALPALEAARAARGISAPLRLAHAYERVMPGPRYVDSIRRFWRVFAGIDEASSTRAREFLGSFIEVDTWPLRELESPAASEVAKILENSYRAVTIALMHEWALLAERAGVNLFEVVEAIRLRRGTHDNMRLPGFGVGGYCLTKDALLAQWSADDLFGGGLELEMSLQALRINYTMPDHTLDVLREVVGRPLAGSRIALCGVAYLPGLADTRNSPAERLVDRLHAEGAEVIAHDPCVTTWRERPDIVLGQDLAAALAGADGVVMAVPHRAYRELEAADLTQWTGRPGALVDAQDILTDASAAVLHAEGWRVAGVGKGHWRARGFQCPA